MIVREHSLYMPGGGPARIEGVMKNPGCSEGSHLQMLQTKRWAICFIINASIQLLMCSDHDWQNITGTRGVSSVLFSLSEDSELLWCKRILLTITFSFTCAFVTSLTVFGGYFITK